MKKFLLVLLSCLSLFKISKAQYGFDEMVELTGVIMSADSLRYLPFVNVSIPSRNSGTVSTDKGLFTLIVEKGDTLEFSSIGYRKKTYVIPKELSSNRYSIIQLMTQDTFYLANTIIRPQLTKEEFEKAFKTWDIPDDKFESARKNTEYQVMRMMIATLPKDGRESQHNYQNMQAQKNYWAGQQPPMTIFSPLAWMEFIKAWKRGDFRRKK
ncbi:MAG: carboxypeptidase-like regulatory domain-containing protein [Chitinophagaceae bacterium]|nr:carboxypeptidase-like regulatory domain-containing protein [Chitinophagaceae bacterium]